MTLSPPQSLHLRFRACHHADLLTKTGEPQTGEPQTGEPRASVATPPALCPATPRPPPRAPPQRPRACFPRSTRRTACVPAERRVTLSDGPAATASPPRVPPSTVCSRCPLCPWRPFRAPRGSGCRCRPSSSNAEVAYVPPATPWLLGVFPEEKETLSSRF